MYILVPYIKEYIGGLLEFYGCRVPDYSRSAILQYLSLNGEKLSFRRRTVFIN